MLSYIYIESGSNVRGQNVNIRVYRIKNNKPTMIGREDYNTAGWPGAHGAAFEIIAQNEGFKTQRQSYGGLKFVRKDISIKGI